MMGTNEKYQDMLAQGTTLMKLQRYAEAKESFQAAVNEDPACVDGYLCLGDVCVNLDEFDEAINAFTGALVADKKSGEALFSVANVYYLQDDIANAIKYYVKAENAGYQTADMYLIMANIFYNNGDTIQALRYVSRAIKEAPLEGSLWRQRVLLELELGKVDTALDTLDEFESILPEALDIHELRTKILIQMGEYNAASEHLAKALASYPEDMRIRLLQLHLDITKGDFDQAKAEIDELKKRELSPDECKKVALEASSIYLQEQDTSNIISSIDWGLRKCPNDPDLLFVKLNTYIASLDHQNIIVIAGELLSIEGLDNSVVACAEFYHALSLRETGKGEEATERFKALSKKLRKFTIDAPESLDLFIYRILTHSALGEYEKALELADYLGKVSPDEATAHAFRSVVYREMGDEENAQREQEIARQINPNYKR